MRDHQWHDSPPVQTGILVLYHFDLSGQRSQITQIQAALGFADDQNFFVALFGVNQQIDLFLADLLADQASGDFNAAMRFVTASV